MGTRWQSTLHERDLETGWDFRGARMYNADLGRFLSLDPMMGYYVGWSPYHYVLGDPTGYTDPTGMKVCLYNKVDGWYTDECGNLIFSPVVNSQKDLEAKGIRGKFVGQSFNQEAKIGGGQFRADGSIFYSNQTEAFSRLWTSSFISSDLAGRVENLMFATNRGYLILPNYRNTYSSSETEEVGYAVKNNELYDPISKEMQQIRWSAHTHPADLGGYGPSPEDMKWFGMNTPSTPGFVLEENYRVFFFISDFDKKAGRYRTYQDADCKLP